MMSPTDIVHWGVTIMGVLAVGWLTLFRKDMSSEIRLAIQDVKSEVALLRQRMEATETLANTQREHLTDSVGRVEITLAQVVELNRRHDNELIGVNASLIAIKDAQRH